MRAVVFAGAGGNEVIRLEELPRSRAGQRGGTRARRRMRASIPADLSQREGSTRRRRAARRTSPGSRSPARRGLRSAGARLAAGRPRLRPRRRRRARRPRRRAPALRRAVPDALDEPGAAAVPEAFITAHDAIRSQSALSMGETLLVHGAAGGVGSAAVQIGVAGGARVFGTVRSADAARAGARARRRARRRRGFADAVLAATDGRGADVDARARRRAALPRQPARRRRPRAGSSSSAWCRRRGLAGAAPADGAPRRACAARCCAPGRSSRRRRRCGRSSARSCRTSRRAACARSIDRVFPYEQRGRGVRAPGGERQARQGAAALRVTDHRRHPMRVLHAARGPRAGAARPADALARASLRRARALLGHDSRRCRRLAADARAGARRARRDGAGSRARRRHRHRAGSGHPPRPLSRRADRRGRRVRADDRAERAPSPS